jgi:hypothetical protein
MRGLSLSLPGRRKTTKAKEKGNTEPEEDRGTSLTSIILARGLNLFAMIFPALHPASRCGLTSRMATG